MTNTSTDKRVVFVWRGAGDADRLAETIAASIEIYAHNEGLVVLEGDKLKPVNMSDFHNLVSQHICGLRIVSHGNGYKRERFAYQFPAKPHPGPPTAATGPARWTDSTEPDMKVLSEIYGQKLLKLLPRVE
jgi:hypothetical protein